MNDIPIETRLRDILMRAAQQPPSPDIPESFEKLFAPDQGEIDLSERPLSPTAIHIDRMHSMVNFERRTEKAHGDPTDVGVSLADVHARCTTIYRQMLSGADFANRNSIDVDRGDFFPKFLQKCEDDIREFYELDDLA